MVNTVLL